jgi:hypothetical protein
MMNSAMLASVFIGASVDGFIARPQAPPPHCTPLPQHPVRPVVKKEIRTRRLKSKQVDGKLPDEYGRYRLSAQLGWILGKASPT